MPESVTDELRNQFIRAWEDIEELVYQNARDKGFYDKQRNQGEMIALIHSEISEALEALRFLEMPESTKIPEYTLLEEELADCIIRIMDFAQHNNLIISDAIIAKMAYNAKRPPMHGKKF